MLAYWAHLLAITSLLPGPSRICLCYHELAPFACLLIRWLTCSLADLLHAYSTRIRHFLAHVTWILITYARRLASSFAHVSGLAIRWLIVPMFLAGVPNAICLPTCSIAYFVLSVSSLATELNVDIGDVLYLSSKVSHRSLGTIWAHGAWLVLLDY